MRRAWKSFLAAAVLLTAAGCQAEETTLKPELKTEQSCAVHYGDQKYQCKLQFLGEGTEGLTIEEPSSLCGMTFRHTGGKYSLAYGSLLCKSDDSLLPETSFPVRVMKVMQDLRKNREEIVLTKSGSDYVCSRKAAVPYTIKSDETGKIISIQL